MELGRSQTQNAESVLSELGRWTEVHGNHEGWRIHILRRKEEVESEKDIEAITGFDQREAIYGHLKPFQWGTEIGNLWKGWIEG